MRFLIFIAVLFISGRAVACSCTAPNDETAKNAYNEADVIITAQVVAASDGWTLRTLDGSLAAHYEHTVAIWDGKPYILTSPDATESNDVFGGF